MLERFLRFRFLFEELIKRDFKKKYKRTVLGIFWSILSPLLNLLVMALVFTQFFGRNTPHYIIYVFAGNLVFSYYREATAGGMMSLVSNAGIISKVNVPKYMFILSRNVQSLINFLLTLVVFFIFVAFDSLPFRLSFFMLLYPVVCMVLFNAGVGMILSALYVFFRDIEYLYSIFTTLLMYLSAIFYNISAYEPYIQQLFLINPLYVYILYFRTIVIDGAIPSLLIHGLCLLYALIFGSIGGLMYRRLNYKFIYYL